MIKNIFCAYTMCYKCAKWFVWLTTEYMLKSQQIKLNLVENVVSNVSWKQMEFSSHYMLWTELSTLKIIGWSFTPGYWKYPRISKYLSAFGNRTLNEIIKVKLGQKMGTNPIGQVSLKDESHQECMHIEKKSHRRREKRWATARQGERPLEKPNLLTS